MIHIKTPATSANMGPGFDSLGVALTLYNELWVEEIPSGLEIIVKRKQAIEIPEDETNLIYQTMAVFFKKAGQKIPGLRLIQEDNIPMVRGLGSSAACIVGGLLAANALCGGRASIEELAQIAAQIEGHPDNTTPAFFGSMVVGAQDENKMGYVKLDVPKDLVFATMIPDFPVSTHDARNVLPKEYSRADMVFNASRTALFVASICSGKYENLPMAMEDCVHQPYRKKLIPDMDNIFQAAKDNGALASYLSGAGSTLMSIVQESNVALFEENMKQYLKSIPHNWKLALLRPDTNGAQITTKP